MSSPSHRLSAEQASFVRQCVGQWLRLSAPYFATQNRHPTSADVDHSALLARLIAGQKVFDKPPPRAYSYPWYQLVEDGRYEGDCEVHVYRDGLPVAEEKQPTVVLCQAIWRLIETDADGLHLIEWPETGLRATLRIGNGQGGVFKRCVIEVQA